jgi:rfaE bifunctional protein kinase chain/domain
MNSNRLKEILSQIKKIKIAVIGDFAVDFYFQENTNTSEFSVETGKNVFWGQQPKGFLGGAGNVAKNVTILGAKAFAFGAIGTDLFGREMLFQCASLGIESTHLMRFSDIDTPTYSKPMWADLELNRIDFGTQNKQFNLKSETLIQQLETEIDAYDWVLVNEQFQNPLLNKASIKKLLTLIHQHKKSSLADLRNLGAEATEIPLKVNESELAAILKLSPQQLALDETLITIIKNWVSKRKTGALVTLGERGLIYASPTEFHWQTGIKPTGKIDTVGAGDMVVAAFSAAKASGANTSECCEFANLCAHISIHKIGETGAASPEEIEKLNLSFL